LILHEKGDAIVLRVPPIAAEGKSLVISLLNLPFSVLPLYLV
jgi:ABC-type sulfate transport system permease subunit